MLRHYLEFAWRVFKHEKWLTLIKVLALALGFACFIGAYVFNDYVSSVDQHFSNASRTYVMRRKYEWTNSKTATAFEPYTTGLLARPLSNENPDLAAVARLSSDGHAAIKTGDRKSYRSVAFADPSLLKIFNFSFIAGDPAHALTNPHSAILTKQAALSIFGTLDVVGRSLRIDDLTDVTVTGVVGPIPAPSILGRSILGAPFEILSTRRVYEQIRAARQPGGEGWATGDCYTFVLFPKNGSLSLAAFNKRLQGFGDRHVPKGQGRLWFDAVPLSSVLRQTINESLLGSASGMSITTMLFLFGGLILAIACLDFANLATAQAMSRAKEIGMRKTLGATRIDILLQCLFEVLLLSVAALAIALVVVAAVVAMVNQPADLGFRFPSLLHPGVWAFLLSALALTILAAGAYPALVLARVRPIFALRAGTLRAGPPLARSLLVGVQFAAASFLLVAIFVMQAQNRALLAKAVGAVKDGYIYINSGLDEAKIDPKVFRSELLQFPEIKGVTGVRTPPFITTSEVLDFTRTPNNATKHIPISLRGISYDYFKTMGIKLLAGRGLSEARGDEPPAPQQMTSSSPLHYVFDAASIKALGFASPQAAIGKTVYMHFTAIPELGGVAKIVPVEIVGVAENRPLQFRVSISASFGYFFLPAFAPMPIIRVDRGETAKAVRDVESVWNRLAPDVPLSYQFWDDRIANSLSLFHAVNAVFLGLGAMAILIASMGLLGMASFTVSRRRHEIGIRKTLGATSQRVLRLLLWETSRPVLAANIIAWPLAYLAAEAYLSQFIFRAGMGPLPFAASLVLTLVFAWLAVGGQAVPAARVRPGRVLRYE